MVFNGAAAGETVTMTANGDRLTFFRNPAAHHDGHRRRRDGRLQRARRTDSVTVGDLTEDVKQVNLDLAAASAARRRWPRRTA